MKRDIFSSFIARTGACIPTKVVPNSHFWGRVFYDSSGTPMQPNTDKNLLKFEDISLIGSRRYIEDHQTSLDIAVNAAREANDPDLELDLIVAARNFKNLKLGQFDDIDMVPNHASRIKHYFASKKPEILDADYPDYPVCDLIVAAYNLGRLKDNMAFCPTDLVLEVTGFDQTGLYESAEAELLRLGVAAEKLSSIIVIHVVEKADCMAEQIAEELGITYDLLLYDVVSGCPGFLQAFLHADAFIRTGKIKRGLVVGFDTLSRNYDPFDRNCPLYADGAGALLLERLVNSPKVGVLTSIVKSYVISNSKFLWMGPSNNQDYLGSFLNMDAEKVFQFTHKWVPLVIKEALDKAGVKFNEVAKIIPHQANGRINYSNLATVAELSGYDKSELGSLLPKKHSAAIIGELINKHGIRDIPPGIMAMTIDWLGNSSVATIATLLHLIMTGQLEGHIFKSGDILVLVTVGAGPTIIVAVIRLP